MPLPQPQMPSSHRARRNRRHASAAAAAAGRRAVRRPSLLPKEGRLSPGVLCAVGAVITAVIVAARAGAFSQLFAFLDFGAGVLSLVSLTATVLWGLAATDRAVLGSGHRLLAQGAHRGLAVSGLLFLALHIWIKVAGQRTTATSAAVPFTDATRPVLVGLGSLAGYLFIAVAISGAVRSVFNTRSGSAWWRVLHFGAYPAWGASLVHGLKSGRAAAPGSRPRTRWPCSGSWVCSCSGSGAGCAKRPSSCRPPPARGGGARPGRRAPTEARLASCSGSRDREPGPAAPARATGPQ